MELNGHVISFVYYEFRGALKLALLKRLWPGAYGGKGDLGPPGSTKSMISRWEFSRAQIKIDSERIVIHPVREIQEIMAR